MNESSDAIAQAMRQFGLSFAEASERLSTVLQDYQRQLASAVMASLDAGIIPPLTREEYAAMERWQDETCRLCDAPMADDGTCSRCGVPREENR